MGVHECQRPYSIRTRIKTAFMSSASALAAGQRPYSIRTRIKTYLADVPEYINFVRDHIPLEQGLRHLQADA